MGPKRGLGDGRSASLGELREPYVAPPESGLSVSQAVDEPPASRPVSLITAASPTELMTAASPTREQVIGAPSPGAVSISQPVDAAPLVAPFASDPVSTISHVKIGLRRQRARNLDDDAEEQARVGPPAEGRSELPAAGVARELDAAYRVAEGTGPTPATSVDRPATGDAH